MRVKFLELRVGDKVFEVSELRLGSYYLEISKVVRINSKSVVFRVLECSTPTLVGETLLYQQDDKCLKHYNKIHYL